MLSNPSTLQYSAISAKMTQYSWPQLLEQTRRPVVRQQMRVQNSAASLQGILRTYWFQRQWQESRILKQWLLSARRERLALMNSWLLMLKTTSKQCYQFRFFQMNYLNQWSSSRITGYTFLRVFSVMHWFFQGQMDLISALQSYYLVQHTFIPQFNTRLWSALPKPLQRMSISYLSYYTQSFQSISVMKFYKLQILAKRGAIKPLQTASSLPSFGLRVTYSTAFTFSNARTLFSAKFKFRLTLLFALGMFIQCRSLKYSPLNPPKMSKLLPKKQALCLLRALGISPCTLRVVTCSFAESRIRISLRSLQNRPPKTQILPSQTEAVCPQRVRKVLSFILRSFQARLSTLPVSKKEVRSIEQISLRHRYFEQQPAITKNSLPILAEAWNLLALGLVAPLGIGTSVQPMVMKLKTHKSSKSLTPSPPQTTKQGQNNSAV